MAKKQYTPTTKQVEKTPVDLTSFISGYREGLGDGSSELRGISTGVASLDSLIGGLDRFILLAGRSGAGKTTLAMQLAYNVAKSGTPVLIYSYEMSRPEIITKLVQVTSKALGLSGLKANTIELKGNDPKLPDDQKEAIKNSLLELENRTGERLYIKDQTNEQATNILPKTNADKTPNMLADIEAIKNKHYKETDTKKPVLVIIDSVQDVVDTGRDNTVQAEIKAVTDLTRLQQLTGATILATAQKNKGSISSIDSYGDVMGSMSFIHKPNTVIELLTPRELANKAPTKTEQERLKQTAIDAERDASRGLGKPIYLNVIKSRFTGDGGMKLTYYGAYGYYEDKADLNYSDLYENIDN